MGEEKAVVENAFAQIRKMRDDVANDIKKRLADRYAEKEETKARNAYYGRLEHMAPEWMKLLGNAEFKALQQFLKEYREAVLESMLKGAMDPLTARGQIATLDLLIHEPIKVVKEYEAMKKALQK